MESNRPIDDLGVSMFDFRIEAGKYGQCFVPEEEWSSEMTEYCLSHSIRDIYLNIAFGWPGYDISFLKDLPGLLGLKVLTDRVDNLSFIECQTELRSLSLSLLITDWIDFASFPDLDEVYLIWSPKIQNLFQSRSLRELRMSRYKSVEGDLSAFCSLSNLESIVLKVCNIKSIGDLSCLTKMRRLKIARATKLMSLAGIEALSGLRELHIEGCRKIAKIDPVGQLKDLERLLLPNNGEIESIKPLHRLKKLRKFLFYDSTKIMDGDLTPLKALPDLEDVAFAQRRHYNLKREDLPRRT